VNLKAALIVMVALILVGVAIGAVPRLRRSAELVTTTREGQIPSVSVVSPKPGKSEVGLPLPAEIKPWVETPIYARANGYLKARHVDIGTPVEEGALLAEIDTPELDQELERAKALQAQAEAALDLATITSRRWAGLSKTSAVSDQENQEKQADLKLKAATADGARAEVRRLEELKSFTRITAPFAGTITSRNVDTGDLITAGGAKELFHLAQTKRLRVFVQVPQSLARSVQPGLSAELEIPELPGRSFPAVVIRTAGVMAADSRTLLAELAVENPHNEILAGGFARVRFSEANTEGAMTLPANTVLFLPKGPVVGLVKDDGTVELRKVKLGRDFGRSVEILTGLSPKDRVILNPSDSLSEGTKVAVREPTKETKGR
jgi:RND family efflux transporter MFP subunit